MTVITGAEPQRGLGQGLAGWRSSWTGIRDRRAARAEWRRLKIVTVVPLGSHTRGNFLVFDTHGGLSSCRRFERDYQFSPRMPFAASMNRYIHDIVRHLLDLNALEDRLAAPSSDAEPNAETLIKVLREKLPVGVLIPHDKMRVRGKCSVAGIRRGVCTGCHLALGFGNVAAVRAGELRRCGNCGRYVYVVEEEQSALPPKSKRHPLTRSVPASG